MAASSASAAVGEVLRQPDDLVKLTAYRNKLLKEKAALDAKLQEGVRAKLDATRDALLKLQESRAASALIREEMIEVGKLKRDKDEGEIFDKITLVSGVHRNFSQTAKMVNQLQSMADRVDRLAAMLDEDRADPDAPCGPSPNLLPIHFQLQQLEAFRNETLHAAKRGPTASEDEIILRQWFEPLDRLAEQFEAWLWEIGGNIVEITRRGNASTVVRLVKIVEFEGKEDEKAVAVRLVRKMAADPAANLPSMQANARVIKNYRHKLLDAIERSITAKLERHYDDAHGDILHFIDGLQFVYKDIIRIQDDLGALFPEDYKIVEWMVKRYHKALNSVLRMVVDSQPGPAALLELNKWVKEYRTNMKELEVPPAWLQPPLLDGRSQDLIEDYVRLIIAKLDEWTRNLQKQETANFKHRAQPPNSGTDGIFGLDGVIDFFQLVNQQVGLALDSNQGAVLARVVTECSNVMRRVQAEWVALVAAEAQLQAEHRERPEELAPGLVEYVMALANDQLRAADHAEELQARLEPLVSDKYKTPIVDALNKAIDGYLDVAKRCTNTLVEFIFNDLRPATRGLVLPEWYHGQLVPQIIETMRDYMSDYQAHLNGAIFDILVEDLIDVFLITYLTALRRAPPKALRMPAAAARVRDDIGLVFAFFETYKPAQELDAQFEIMNMVCSMLEASAEMLYMDYWTFARAHGPQLAFVEALLRARDDLDRSAVAEVMETLRRKVREEGIQDPEEPTIMVKVHGQSGAAGLMANVKKYADNIAGQTGRLKNWRDD